MQRGTLVTRDAKAAEGLGLSAADASRLILSGAGGAKLCELTVGRQGTSGGSYIRVGNGAEVFQTGEGLAGYLSSQRASWLDLRVLPRDVKPDAVMRISVQSSLPLPDGKGPSRIDYTLLKEKDSSGAMSWSLAPKEMRGADSVVGKLDQQAVGSLVSAVVGLEGTDILPAGDAAATGLSAPAAQVTISLTDNRTFVIAVGSRTQAGQYPCVLKDAASAFLVAEWRIQGSSRSEGEAGRPGTVARPTAQLARFWRNFAGSARKPTTLLPPSRKAFSRAARASSLIVCCSTSLPARELTPTDIVHAFPLAPAAFARTASRLRTAWSMSVSGRMTAKESRPVSKSRSWEAKLSRSSAAMAACTPGRSDSDGAASRRSQAKAMSWSAEAALSSSAASRGWRCSAHTRPLEGEAKERPVASACLPAPATGRGRRAGCWPGRHGIVVLQARDDEDENTADQQEREEEVQVVAQDGVQVLPAHDDEKPVDSGLDG